MQMRTVGDAAVLVNMTLLLELCPSHTGDTQNLGKKLPEHGRSSVLSVQADVHGVAFGMRGWHPGSVRTGGGTTNAAVQLDVVPRGQRGNDVGQAVLCCP